MADSSRSAARRPKLGVERLEDRTVPTFLPRAPVLSPAVVDGVALPPNGQGGLSIAIGDVVQQLPLISQNEYVVGTGPGIEGTVRVYDNQGTLLRQFVPFAGYTGGLNVAVGDVIGDSRAEIVVTPAGQGLPMVGVFTPEGQVLSLFLAFSAGYTGGLNVAVGNVMNETGGSAAAGAPGQPNVKSEIIVGAATVAPAVQVFTGNGTLQRFFFAFPANAGTGVTVAAANIDDTRGPGPGPGANSYAEIIVGAASIAPLIGIYTVQGVVTQLQQYFAFDPSIASNRTGVTVAAGSTDGTADFVGGTRGAEIYVALTNGSRIRGFRGATGIQFADVAAYPSAYSRVVNMAVGNVSSPFLPQDENGTGGGGGPFGGFSNGIGVINDLAVVAGDGAFFQVPRIYFGGRLSPAGLNGP